MTRALVFLIALQALLVAHGRATAAPPNVLFIIADDSSRSWGEAYGCRWAKTSNIDRLAKAGLVFDNAYTPTSKCAP
ncbi:MAG TPA: sulfatase-like hydrolase/transferase, partial [Caulifigura sp.]|nr:sulfatase-like hydrolase/transferase [Caulifigura sp.]